MSYSLAQTPLHYKKKKPPKSSARNHQNSALILINCTEYSPSHLGMGQKLQNCQEVTSIKHNDVKRKTEHSDLLDLFFSYTWKTNWRTTNSLKKNVRYNPIPTSVLDINNDTWVKHYACTCKICADTSCLSAHLKMLLNMCLYCCDACDSHRMFQKIQVEECCLNNRTSVGKK